MRVDGPTTRRQSTENKHGSVVLRVYATTMHIDNSSGQDHRQVRRRSLPSGSRADRPAGSQWDRRPRTVRERLLEAVRNTTARFTVDNCCRRCRQTSACMGTDAALTCRLRADGEFVWRRRGARPPTAAADLLRIGRPATMLLQLLIIVLAISVENGIIKY